MEPADYGLSAGLTEALQKGYGLWADHLSHERGWGSPKEETSTGLATTLPRSLVPSLNAMRVKLVEAARCPVRAP